MFPKTDTILVASGSFEKCRSPEPKEFESPCYKNPIVILHSLAVWHWGSHCPSWLIHFSIQKEEVSYLPFGDSVRMYLAFNREFPLICQELIFNINEVHGLPLNSFLCSCKVLSSWKEYEWKKLKAMAMACTCLMRDCLYNQTRVPSSDKTVFWAARKLIEELNYTHPSTYPIHV